MGKKYINNLEQNITHTFNDLLWRGEVVDTRVISASKVRPYLDKIHCCYVVALFYFNFPFGFPQLSIQPHK